MNNFLSRKIPLSKVAWRQVAVKLKLYYFIVPIKLKWFFIYIGHYKLHSALKKGDFSPKWDIQHSLIKSVNMDKQINNVIKV